MKLWTSSTYIDACCKNIPLRQRTLTGLGLKIMYLRLKNFNNGCVDKNEEELLLKLEEYFRLENMTDEEYEEMIERK